jgi:hypothetical protein
MTEAIEIAVFAESDIEEIYKNKDNYRIYSDYETYKQKVMLVVGYIELVRLARPEGTLFSMINEIGDPEETVLQNIIKNFSDGFSEVVLDDLLSMIIYMGSDFKVTPDNIRRVFYFYEEISTDVIWDKKVGCYRVWNDSELETRPLPESIGEEKVQYEHLDISSRLQQLDITDIILTMWAASEFEWGADKSKHLIEFDMNKTDEENFNLAVEKTGVGNMYRFLLPPLSKQQHPKDPGGVITLMQGNEYSISLSQYKELLPGSRDEVTFSLFDSFTWGKTPFFQN